MECEVRRGDEDEVCGDEETGCDVPKDDDGGQW